MLKNGSFEDGWTDMPPAPGYLINQQPNGWTLRWIEPGEKLFDVDDKASGVPECVHKLSKQLPANEQLGAADALILEGSVVYKIFHFGGSFGTELKQTVTGLKPGSTATLTVPILAVTYDQGDPYGTESGVWINGEGEWRNGNDMKNRVWFEHKVVFTVPDNGTAVIEIRVKNKWPVKKDFFIDNITLDAEEGSGSTAPPSDDDTVVTPVPDDKEGYNVIRVSVPAGMNVITAVSNSEDTVIITAPAGTTIVTE